MTAPDDENIWASYARGVKKIGEKEEPPKPARKNVPTKITAVAAREEKTPAPVPVSVPTKPAAPAKDEPLDVRVERNLSLGDVVIEARLDLHGKTEEQAHEALGIFLEKQRALGRKLVLVITGKGANGQSPLRLNLPRWCAVDPFSRSVRAVRTAAPHHGGDGAYYLLLRKATK